jgi:hypothetical protein
MAAGDDGIMRLSRRRERIAVEFQPMSPDEVQRMMQFLLSQQAQFAADMAAHEARFQADLEKLGAKADRIADALHGLTGIVGHVASNVERLGDRVDRLAESQQRTDEQLRATNKRVEDLARLFERHLREDHGHRPS